MLDRLFPVMSPRVSVALLVLRLITGASFIAHGLPKLARPASWDEHGPLPGVPAFLQVIVALTETLGGAALILGLLTPLVAFLQTCDMLVVVGIVKIGHGIGFVYGALKRSFPAAELIDPNIR